MALKKFIWKILIPSCALIIPIARLLMPNSSLTKSDYLIAGAVLAFQLLCSAAWYLLLPRWSLCWAKYQTPADWPSTLPVADRMSDLLFTSFLILFAYVFPYAFYLHRPIPVIDTLFCIVLCFDLFAGRLSLLPADQRRKARNLPFCTLTALLVFLAFKQIANATIIPLILLCTFCAETAICIVLQRTKQEEGSS